MSTGTVVLLVGCIVLLGHEDNVTLMALGVEVVGHGLPLVRIRGLDVRGGRLRGCFLPRAGVLVVLGNMLEEH